MLFKSAFLNDHFRRGGITNKKSDNKNNHDEDEGDVDIASSEWLHDKDSCI